MRNGWTIRERVRGKVGPLVFCEAHSGLSALLAQEARGEGRKFDGLWVSSLTDSMVRGLPDREIVSLRERAERVVEIASASFLPILVDCDTGGTVAQLRCGARSLVQSGAAGLVIEDKRGEKENSLRAGARHVLEDPDLFAEKLSQATEALSGKEIILARLECLVCGESIEDALTRAEIYLHVGSADGVIIHSKSQEPDEVLDFAARFREQFSPDRAILGCIPTAYNRITVGQLGEAGFQIVIFANHLLRASVKAMRETARTLLVAGRGAEAEESCIPVGDLLDLVEGEG